MKKSAKAPAKRSAARRTATKAGGSAAAEVRKLLRSKDSEVRCAAAMVLGRLRPIDPETPGALRRMLATEEAPTRAYVIDGLAATGSPDVIEDILPFLEVRGASAEQAIRALRPFKKAALAPIIARHEGVKGWRSGACLKAVASILDKAAVEFVFDKLDEVDWEEARATSLFLREIFPRYPKSAQTVIVRRVNEILTRTATTTNTNALTTALKLAAALGEEIGGEIPVRHVAPFVERGWTPTIRRHALLALLELKPEADDVVAMRPRLFAYAEEANVDDIAFPALRVIDAWSSPPIEYDDLRRLTESRHGAVAEWALEQLFKRNDATSDDDVMKLLASPRPELRSAAMATLASIEGGGKRLIEAFMTEPNERVRDEIARVVSERRESIDRADIDRLSKKWIADVAGGAGIDRALLALVAGVDRERFNRRLLAAVRLLRRSNRCEDVLTLLQPVVRGRFATEEVRIQLAFANLFLAGDSLTLEDQHFKRAADLFGPLARTYGYDLAARLIDEPSLDDSRRLAIVAALFAKGEAEGGAARKILAAIRPDSLPPSSIAEYRRMTRSAPEPVAEDS